MAVGIFVTGAFTLLVPTGRPSENQNNHYVQANTETSDAVKYFSCKYISGCIYRISLTPANNEVSLCKFSGQDSTSLELGKVLCSCTPKPSTEMIIYTVLSVSLT